MRKRVSNIHTTVRSRPGRVRAQSDLPFGRIIASGSILILLLLVCVWVPIAWADAGASGDQYSGYEQAVVPGTDDGADASAATSTGSPVTADMPVGDTASVNTVSAETGSGGSGDDDEDDSAAADEYNLSLICSYGDPGTYWASWDDYVNGLLSVDYLLTNNGPGSALNLHVETATASSGVTLASLLPDIGTLEAGEWTIFTLQWQVPGGVHTFTTQLTICSGCDDDDDDSDDDSDDDDSDDDSDDDDSDDDSDDDTDLDDDDSDDSDDDDSDDDDSDDDDSNDSDDDSDDNTNIVDDTDDDSNDGGNSQVDDNSVNPDSSDGNTNDTSGSNGTAGSNFSLTAAVERGSLPLTGLSLFTAVIIALGAMTPLGMVFMPIAKLIRVRRK